MSVVLSFDQVGTGLQSRHRGVRAEGIALSLGPGEVAMIHADHESEDLPFLELAVGLLEPDCGQVCFAGRNWCEMHYAAQLKARSRIGALAKEQIWLANQTVLRNVLLGQRHHTVRREGELEAEADALAQKVGLTEVPRARPDAVPPRQLRMAGWVRALVGDPVLLVLLFPEHEAISGWSGMLDAVLQQALSRGAAALVVSDQARVWQLPVMNAARHYGVQHGVWGSLDENRASSGSGGESVNREGL